MSEVAAAEAHNGDAMTSTSLLHGLTPRDSILALHKLLFRRSLQAHFGADHTFDWCIALLKTLAAEDHAGFTAHYNAMAAQVRALTATYPRPSIDHPPPAMISMDMLVGAIPWISPLFDRCLLQFLLTGGAVPDPLRQKTKANVLALAFVLSGGPGEREDTAIRICAPCPSTRVAAEHWIMRAYLWRMAEGSHYALGPTDDLRTFSLHTYTDLSGRKRNIYFDTTASFGREEADFLDFLHRDK